MTINASRRQFVALAPFGLLPLLTACSPPAPSPAPAPVDLPPAAAPMPTPTPAQAPEATQAPATVEPLTMVEESDPQAVALAYVEDVNRIDPTQQDRFVAGSRCDNCALYQGQPGVAQGPCTIFGGQGVTANGWCTAWARRA